MAYAISDLNRDGIPKLLNGVADAAQWEAKREEIRRVWLELIGGIPERVPVRYTVLSETEERDHVRLHLRYDTVDGDQVPAYLLVPKPAAGVSAASALQGGGAGGQEAARLPAVLALHPTADAGKADVALASGRDNRRYGLELAARGYVVLAPDTIAAGERVYEGAAAYQTAPFYARYPRWTAVAKMAVDHMQGVDLLAALPFVDPERIGAIGHSLGGYNAFFLAGLDARIRAVVSSCGFCTFTGDPQPNRWGRRDWFTHIPRITDELAEGRVPFEWHEIAALAAPTPFFNWSGQADHIFPNWQPIAEAMLDLHGVYELSGAGDRFVSLLGNSGHDFPSWARLAAYDFLDRWLR